MFACKNVCLLALPSFLLERRAEHLSLFVSVFTGAARQAGWAERAHFDCALVAAHKLLELSELSQQEVFSVQNGHPVDNPKFCDCVWG